MPLVMISVRSWPARPTNGSPLAVLVARPAPRRRTRAARCGLPTPKTICVRAGAACSAGSRRCRAQRRRASRRSASRGRREHGSAVACRGARRRTALRRRRARHAGRAGVGAAHVRSNAEHAELALVTRRRARERVARFADRDALRRRGRRALYDRDRLGCSARRWSRDRPVVCWPGDALAWGPVTHLVHGSKCWRP